MSVVKLPFNIIIGNRIRSTRHERGWTQQFLADKACICRNFISRIEKGELGISLFVANSICEALNIPLETLDST